MEIKNIIGAYFLSLILSAGWVFLYAIFNPVAGWLLFLVAQSSILTALSVYLICRKRALSWLKYILLQLILSPICLLLTIYLRSILI